MLIVNKVVFLVFLCVLFVVGCCALWNKRGEASHPTLNNLFTDLMYIGYGIQNLNRRKDCSQKFTTTKFSSSQFLHLCTEEFLPFFVVGPGTSNCVDYRQIFILSVFSSSHKRDVGEL